MTFFGELEKSIKFNAILAATAAIIFVFGYELTIFVYTYGVFPLVIAALVLGFMLDMFLSITGSSYDTLFPRGAAAFWPRDELSSGRRSTSGAAAVWLSIILPLIGSPWVGHTITMAFSGVAYLVVSRFVAVAHEKRLTEKKYEAQKGSDEKV